MTAPALFWFRRDLRLTDNPGCGADAAPYFRIFNPVLQGEKFDPHGDYVRRWCPELADLPNRFIHKPWEADRRSGRQPQTGAGRLRLTGQEYLRC